MSTTSAMPDGLSGRALSAMRWSLLSQVLRQSLQFIISVVLARLLPPEDFGLVAMVLVFSGFLALFADLGLSTAIIQRRLIEPSHTTSAFLVTVVAGAVLAVMLFLAAPLLVGFYDESRLLGVTRLVALNLALTSLGAVPGALMVRSLQLKRLAMIEVTSIMVGGASACFLALRGSGPVSLVYQGVIGSALSVALLFWLGRWRPSAGASWRAVRDLAGFALPLTGFSTVNYWVRNGDNLLVGRFLGAASLGVYARAYSLMSLPQQQVLQAFGRVMLPVLSPLQGAKGEFKAMYLRGLSLVAFVSFPAMMGLYMTADHFVLGILGPQWEAVVPVLRILSLLGMVQAVGATTGWVFQGMGRTDWQFAWALSSGVLTLGAIGLGVWLGSVEAVALCYAIASGVLLVYPAFAIPGRLIDLAVAEVFRALTRITVCTVAMAGLVWSLRVLVEGRLQPVSMLLLECGAGFVSYVALAHFLRVPQLREVCRFLRPECAAP